MEDEFLSLKDYYIRVVIEILNFQQVPDERMISIDLSKHGLDYDNIFDILQLPKLITALLAIRPIVQRRSINKPKSWDDFGYVASDRILYIDYLLDKSTEYLEKLEEYKKKSTSFDLLRKLKEKHSLFDIPTSGTTPNQISVMMPFAEEYDAVYNKIYNTCNSMNLECRRADHIWHTDVVIQDVFKLIYESKCVIVDLTGGNPNVYYELGITHALDKQFILICNENDKNIPFDIQQYRILFYNLNDMNPFGKRIKKRISDLKKN